MGAPRPVFASVAASEQNNFVVSSADNLDPVTVSGETFATPPAQVP